jgi:transposase InsO family protein
MKLHANPALSLNRRRLLVERNVENNWSLTDAARAAEVSEPTARKWAARYLADGDGALLESLGRSSRPQPHPRGSDRGDLCRAAAALHRRRDRRGPGRREAPTAVAFLRRAIRFFARYGVRVERVMTDNGSAYRSAIHAIACRALGIRHLRTRPYRPQTNGKAERFIRTMLGGWAYGAVYRSSAERAAALEGWLWRYNFQRPHGSLGRKTPAARLHELNNPLGSYS